MNEIYVIGASGFGKEVAWLLEESNSWIIKGFIDDNLNLLNKEINGYNVVGNLDYLLTLKTKINVVIAIGNPEIRKKIVSKLSQMSNITFPNIISKHAILSSYILMGVGNIICSNCILTTNISIGDFNQINLSSTIGHDTILENYITIYPSVNVSGNVKIKDCVEVGTGTQIIQGKKINNNIIIGAGAVVIKDLIDIGTYVGTPVKKVVK